MTIMILLAGIFLSALLCYLLTATEAAFTYLPHGEGEKLTAGGRSAKLLRVLAEQEAFMFSTRLWRVFFEMVSVVLVFAALENLFNKMWVTGPLTALLMSLVGFVLYGVSPRNSGRAKPVSFVKNCIGLVYVLNKFLGPLPRLFTARDKQHKNENTAEGYFTEDELLEFLDRAHTTDVIEDEEAQMVQSIFELDETRIRSVMVPRTDMVTIEVGESLDDALNLFMRSGYSRVPVLGEDFDDIRGFLYQKDVTAAFVAQNRGEPAQSLEELMRPARFEPESKRVMDLLKEMQRESTHVAIVVDEYGGTAGLVTLEDLIEELVGDISDEFDHEKPEIILDSEGVFKVSSRLSIEELGELFGKELEEEEVDTVGGLLALHLGKVPIIGSEVVVEGIGIKAVGTRGRRNQIGTLLVWADETEQETEGSAQAD